MDGALRIEGVPIQEDQVVFRIYIDSVDGVHTSDKFVVALQLKTTVEGLHDNTLRSEDGIPVDLKFGAASIANRIVTSPDRIGTISTICVTAGKQMANIYKGVKP